MLVLIGIYYHYNPPGFTLFAPVHSTHSPQYLSPSLSVKSWALR